MNNEATIDLTRCQDSIPQFYVNIKNAAGINYQIIGEFLTKDIVQLSLNREDGKADYVHHAGNRMCLHGMGILSFDWEP